MAYNNSSGNPPPPKNEFYREDLIKGLIGTRDTTTGGGQHNMSGMSYEQRRLFIDEIFPSAKYGSYIPRAAIEREKFNLGRRYSTLRAEGKHQEASKVQDQLDFLKKL